MSAQQRPEPGTAVSRQDARDELAIGELPPDIQRALTMRKMQNKVAAQLAGMSWGKGLDHDTRRAAADWGQQYGVDVTTEIHVLGNNVYLNAAFWLRKLGEMIAAGLVEYAYADHVESDPRLARLGAEGEGETSRRLRERVMRGIPDEAKSAVVFRVKLRAMDREVVGVKWCGGGTRKNDPVGEAFPIETSESRAARRAMRLVTSHVPSATAQQIEVIQATAEALSGRIEHGRNEIRASESRARSLPPGRSAMPAFQAPLSDPADPYSPIDESRVPLRNADEPRETIASRVAPPRSAEQRVTAEHIAATATDPYEDSGTASDDASSAPPPIYGNSRFVMPFGGEWVGKEMRHVPTDDLRKLIAWAMKSSKGGHAAFIEAATADIDDRMEEARLAAEDAAEQGE